MHAALTDHKLLLSSFWWYNCLGFILKSHVLRTTKIQWMVILNWKITPLFYIHPYKPTTKITLGSLKVFKKLQFKAYFIPKIISIQNGKISLVLGPGEPRQVPWLTYNRLCNTEYNQWSVNGHPPAASRSSSCRLGGIRGSVSLKKFFSTVATALTWMSSVWMSSDGSEIDSSL